MFNARPNLKRLLNYEYTPLLLLVLLTLAIHFASISKPPYPVFDENYYVPAATSIISGAGTPITEHPPWPTPDNSKRLYLFGNNPFGWRLLSIVFGTASIILLYLICRELGMKRGTTLVATFLFAFENLSFTLASVAMLDVFCLTFMLASFWLYLKGHYTQAGLLSGWPRWLN